MILSRGVLGEYDGLLAPSDPAALPTQLVYKVPVGRSAKGKLFVQTAPRSSTWTLVFYVNKTGLLTVSPNIGAGQKLFTIGTADTLFATGTPDGASAATTVALSGSTYILNQGDELWIRATGVDNQNIKVQFVGVEFDAVNVYGCKAGVLGRKLGNTLGLQTVYQVPPGRAAIGNVFAPYVQFSGAGTLAIAVNGITVGTFSTAGANMCTTSQSGIMFSSFAGNLDGTTATKTASLSGVQFRLNENDIVSVNVTGAIVAATPTTEAFVEFSGQEVLL